MLTKYTAYFDGACFPNPNGHAASGALILLNGKRVWETADYIGQIHTSNNVAEYHGLISVLKYLKEHGPCEALIHGDADLVIKQMNKVWRAGTLSKAERKGKIPIKPRYYLPFYHEACALRDSQPENTLTFKWIPRHLNTNADELSTRPLRQRGFRLDYHETPERETDRIDAAFEYAISKD